MLRFYKFDIFCLFFLKKNTKLETEGLKVCFREKVYISIIYIGIHV